MSTAPDAAELFALAIGTATASNDPHWRAGADLVESAWMWLRAWRARKLSGGGVSCARKCARALVFPHVSC